MVSKRKKKFRLIKDNCLYEKERYPELNKIANIKDFEELGLSRSTTDDEILKHGQKENRLVWTSDAGSGFSYKKVTKPNLNRTGAVIVKDIYDEEKQQECMMKLFVEVEFEELKQKRTEVDSDSIKIISSEDVVEIKF